MSPRDPEGKPVRAADHLYHGWADMAGGVPDSVGAMRMYQSNLKDSEAADVSAMGGLQPTVITQVTGLQESQQELSTAIGVGGAADMSDGVSHLQDAAQGTTGVLRENLAHMRTLLQVGHALTGLNQKRAAFLSRLPDGQAKAEAAGARLDEFLGMGQPTEDMALAVTRVAVQTLHDAIQTLQRAVQGRARRPNLTEAERASGSIALQGLHNQVAELESILAGMTEAQDRMELG